MRELTNKRPTVFSDLFTPNFINECMDADTDIKKIAAINKMFTSELTNQGIDIDTEIDDMEYLLGMVEPTLNPSAYMIEGKLGLDTAGSPGLVYKDAEIFYTHSRVNELLPLKETPQEIKRHMRDLIPRLFESALTITPLQ